MSLLIFTMNSAPEKWLCQCRLTFIILFLSCKPNLRLPVQSYQKLLGVFLKEIRCTLKLGFPITWQSQAWPWDPDTILGPPKYRGCHLISGGHCLCGWDGFPYTSVTPGDGGRARTFFLEQGLGPGPLRPSSQPACAPGGSSTSQDSCGLSHHMAGAVGQGNCRVLCHPEGMRASLGLLGPESSLGPMADRVWLTQSKSTSPSFPIKEKSNTK